MSRLGLIFIVLIAILSLNALSMSVIVLGSPQSETLQLAKNFLQNVAGISSSNYPDLMMKVINLDVPQSHHQQSTVSIDFGNNSQGMLFFIDGRFWHYEMFSTSQLSLVNQTTSERLSTAGNVLTNYGGFSKSEFASEMANLIQVSVTAPNSTIEANDAVLNISYNDSSGSNQTVLDCFQKIDGTTTNYQSIHAVFYEDGTLAEFTDYFAAYHVGATSPIMSVEDAKNASTLLAMNYAKNDGISIVATSINLEWWRDYNFVRGNDEFAIYPMWDFTANLNETKNNACTYQVLLWGDTEQVFWKGPQAFLGLSQDAMSGPTVQDTPQPVSYLVMLIGLPVVALVACLKTFSVQFLTFLIKKQ